MKQHIYLRAIEPEDYKISVNWRNDPEINNMIGGPKFYVSRETERKWVEKNIGSNEKIVLAICLKESDKYIGNIMIQDIDWRNRTASVPILIGDKEEWNKGYATEARMEALNYVFNEMGLNRVQDLILENNLGSIKHAEKCGYKKEGLLRSSVFKNGQFYNQVLLGVLKNDFIPIYKEYKERLENN